MIPTHALAPDDHEFARHHSPRPVTKYQKTANAAVSQRSSVVNAPQAPMSGVAVSSVKLIQLMFCSRFAQVTGGSGFVVLSVCWT